MWRVGARLGRRVGREASGHGGEVLAVDRVDGGLAGCGVGELDEAGRQRRARCLAALERLLDLLDIAAEEGGQHHLQAARARNLLHHREEGHRVEARLA